MARNLSKQYKKILKPLINKDPIVKDMLDAIDMMGIGRDQGGTPSLSFLTLLSSNYVLLLREFRLLLNFYGVTLEQAMEANVKKLSSRKERGVLHGDGDKR